MRYIVKDKELILKFMPGKGSWTYHLEIPDTKDIKGNWGSIKVSGFIDNYPIESKNLLPLKGQDKILSINNTIRKAINKSGGEPVNVTLYIHESADQMSEKEILETMKESGVLSEFEKLRAEEKSKIIKEILSQQTEEKQIKILVKYIDTLSR